MAIPNLPQLEADSTNDYPSIQRLIDQEIYRLNESIRGLKTHRNYLSPVSRLPPELVCKIFHYVRNDTVTHLAEFKHPCSMSFRWVSVTHVCKRWMEIALDDASLWSNVIISGALPEWEKEGLIRSKEAPLVVQAWFSDLLPRAAEAAALLLVQLVLPRLQRIKHLAIIGVDQATLHKLISNIPPSSPILSSLNLAVRSIRIQSPTSMFTLSRMVFPDHASLISVSLKGCSIDWEWSLFASLIHLELNDIPNAFRPSLKVILIALKSCASLESLVLSRALPTSAEDLTSSNEIYLPRLSYIHIKATLTEAAIMLPFVFFPDHTIILTECDTMDVVGPGSTIVTSILSVFNRSSHSTRTLLGEHTPAKIIRFLKLEDNPHNFRFEAWEDTNRQTSNSSGVSIQCTTPNMSFSLGLLDIPGVTLATRVCRALSLQHLETLWLSRGTFISVHTWVEVLGGLQQLKSIHLGHFSMIELLYTLDSFTPSSGNHNAVVFLPSLQHLSAEGIRFRDRPSPLEHMEKSISKRREQEVPIHTLSLTNCVHLIPEDVEKLKQIVEHVIWDQKIIDY